MRTLTEDERELRNKLATKLADCIMTHSPQCGDKIEIQIEPVAQALCFVTALFASAVPSEELEVFFKGFGNLLKQKTLFFAEQQAVARMKGTPHIIH